MFLQFVWGFLYIIFVFSWFQGQHLRRGSHLEDFVIRLGDSVCVPVSLTDNQVDCRPPTNKPDKGLNDKSCQGDTVSLKVCIRIIFIVSLVYNIAYM